jgi:hypothetical protein
MASDDRLSRNPITGIAAAGWARATIGRAIAVPPRRLRNSRRLILAPSANMANLFNDVVGRRQHSLIDGCARGPLATPPYRLQA